MFLTKKICSLALGLLTLATVASLVSFLTKSNQTDSKKEILVESPRTKSFDDLANLSFDCCFEDIWF